MSATDNSRISSQAIQNLIATYAHGFDGRDLDLFLSIWWENGAIILPQPMGTVRGHAAIQALLVNELWPTWRWSMHVMSNIVIRYEETTPDHASALSNVCCIGHDPNGRGRIVAGTYRDLFVQRGGTWKLTQRTVDMRWAGPSSTFAGT